MKTQKKIHNSFKLHPRRDGYYRFYFCFEEYYDQITEYKKPSLFTSAADNALFILFNIALNKLIFDKRATGILNPYHLNLDATEKSISIEFSLKDKHLHISRTTFKKALKILERLQFLTIHSSKKNIIVILDVSKCDHSMRLLDKNLDKAYKEMELEARRKYKND